MLSKAQILFKVFDKEDKANTRFIIINSFDRECVDRALFLLHICVNMFNQHPDDISYASLLDAVRFWRANKPSKKFRIPRMDSNQNCQNNNESGFWSRAHVSAPTRKNGHSPPFEETVNTEHFNTVNARLQNEDSEQNLRQPSALVLSEFSVQNSNVPHLNQDDFSRLTLTEFDQPVSYIEDYFTEEARPRQDLELPTLSVEEALDQFLCALQKTFAGGIPLSRLEELLHHPRDQKAKIPPFLFNIILILHNSTGSTNLLELVQNNKNYVHITTNDCLFVRFSKYSGAEDFESFLIDESESARVSFNANDKISMAVEEYAIRMATVFKEKPTVKIFTSENFTSELQSDFYACSIVR